MKASMGARLAASLLEAARRDSRYRVDPELSGPVLWGVMARTAAQAARGALLKPRVPGLDLPCFVGRGVKIVGGRLFSAGTGCRFGDYVLIDAVGHEGIHLGQNVTLDRFVVLRSTGALRQLGKGIRIGSNCSIGAFSYLGGSGGLTIGDNVLGGQRISFHPENHIFQDAAVPIARQGTTRKGITVEDDCWLGSGAIFLDGVIVGRGSVVGAGSVVTSDVEPFSVVGGVPAKKLATRGKSS